MNLLSMRKRALNKIEKKEKTKKNKMKKKLARFLIKMAKQGKNECTFSDCDLWWDSTLSHKEGLDLLEELNKKFEGQILFESRYTTFSGRIKIKEAEQQCEN